jgi:putative nucleotidyltransferase with HDIG domain
MASRPGLPATTLPAPSASQDTLEELWFGEEDSTMPRLEAARSVAAKLAKAQGLRPFPVVAHRVMQLASDPAVGADAVSRVIATDPALASRALKLANSALFRIGKPCDTVDQAIVRLGTRTVYEMMAAVAVLAMFDDARGVGLAIRDHCVAVAGLTRALVKRHGWEGSGQVFLCGLMHDIGKLLCMQSGELPYDALPEEQREVDRVHLYERRILGFDHAVLGAHAMLQWKIPDPVAQVVAWHHQPGRAYQAGGDVGLMVALVRLADQIDFRIANGLPPDGEFIARLATDAALDYLDIDADSIARAWPTLSDARTDVLMALGR